MKQDVAMAMIVLQVFLSSFPETRQHYCPESVHWPVHVFVTPVKFGEMIRDVMCTIRIKIMDNNRKKLKQLTGAY
jgi:hypothetical protein